MTADVERAVARAWRSHGALVWALDFDGTLVPFARRPADVRLAPPVLPLLNALHARPGHTVVLVTGRSTPGLRQSLGGPFLGAVLGNHGADLLAPGLRPPAAWRRDVAALAAAHPGVWLEDKGPSWAIHWRPAAHPAAARAAILAMVQRWTDGNYRTRVGHTVVDVVPRAADKGVSVRRWLQSRGLSRAGLVAVGDDATDEDLFAVANSVPFAPSVSVVVGTRHPTAARLRVANPPAVHRVLAWALAAL